ncbi:MAG: pilus assembly protein TadG-related protein [Pseudomonadota bacterium]
MFGKTREVQGQNDLRTTTAISRFARDDEGSFVIFALFIFIIMIMIGGFAIDLMRYENLRTKMQNTVDRAVLAASDLDLADKATAEAVVDDYLTKAGMGNLPYYVDVSESKIGEDVVGRTVYIDSQVDMNTYFMHMIGTPTLAVPVATKASEGINDVEISLVLDISGSMGWGTKLEDMQDAAEDFIDEVMLNTEEGRVSMSLVPYSTQVNAGATLAAQFNLTGEHSYSHCVDFDETDFNTTQLLPGQLLQQSAHFDPWTSYVDGRISTEDGGEWNQRWACRTEKAAEITPWSIDPGDLKTQIGDLTAQGNTSIDVAAKWGAALLDPSTSTVVDTMIADGDLNPALAGRPAAFPVPGQPSDVEVLKFMIVMTDGINTTQHTKHDDFRSGPSGIWFDPDSRRYSRVSAENGDQDGDGVPNEPYWLVDGYDVDYASEWSDTIYDENAEGEIAAEAERNAYELDWADVFAHMPVKDYAYSMHFEQNGSSADYNAARNATRDNIFAAAKDTRLNTICTQAKNAGIVIFTIGFEVTDDSAIVMERCASTENHFFRVDSDTFDIAYAFDAIANTINQLKLTQ